MTTNPSIPEAAIDAGVRWLMETPDIGTQGAGVVEGILRAAAPHLLKDAHPVLFEAATELAEKARGLQRVYDLISEGLGQRPLMGPLAQALARFDAAMSEGETK